jgi:hypothetical protein
MTNWTPRAANQLGLPATPRLGPVAVGSEGLVSLSFSAQPGRSYEIQAKASLDDPEWTPLAVLAAAGARLVFTDQVGGDSQRFYRVVLLP